MAKVTGPLFGLRASQTIGKTITYASWRGIQYARTRVVPANPNTLSQQAVRKAFSTVNALWAVAGDGLTQPNLWLAKGRPLTDRNVFLQRNAPLIRSEANLDNMVVSPGQSPVPPTTGGVITGGAGQITLDADAPTSPVGIWEYVFTWGVVFTDLNPDTPPYDFVYKQAFTPTPGGLLTITGLPAGVYQARIFYEYQNSSTELEQRFSREYADNPTVS